MYIYVYVYTCKYVLKENSEIGNMKEINPPGLSRETLAIYSSWSQVHFNSFPI